MVRSGSADDGEGRTDVLGALDGKPWEPTKPVKPGQIPPCEWCGSFNQGKKPRGCYCPDWRATARYQEARHALAGPRRNGLGE